MLERSFGRCLPLVAVLVLATPARVPAQVTAGLSSGVWYQGANQRHPFVTGTWSLYLEGRLASRWSAQMEGSTTIIRYLGGTTDVYQLAASALFDLGRGDRVRPFLQAGAGGRWYRNWVEYPFRDTDEKFRRTNGLFWFLGGGARVAATEKLGFRLLTRWLHADFDNGVPRLDDVQNDLVAALGIEWTF